MISPFFSFRAICDLLNYKRVSIIELGLFDSFDENHIHFANECTF